MVCLHQLIEGRRCLVEDSHLLTCKQAQELRRRATEQCWDDDKTSATEKCTPDLPYGEVERMRMEHGPHIVRTEVEPVFGAPEKSDDVLMRDDDALWLA